MTPTALSKIAEPIRLGLAGCVGVKAEALRYARKFETVSKISHLVQDVMSRATRSMKEWMDYRVGSMS